jgi:hypothetical protein
MHSFSNFDFMGASVQLRPFPFYVIGSLMVGLIGAGVGFILARPLNPMNRMVSSITDNLIKPKCGSKGW